MEQYQQMLKSRFSDATESAFEFRSHAFREYVRTPVRSYKESPTRKEYVEFTEEDLEDLIRDVDSSPETGKAVFDEQTNVRFLDDHLVYISEELKRRGVIIADLRDAIRDHPDLANTFVFSFLGSDREEYLVNASWNGGYLIYIPEEERDLTINIQSMVNAATPSVTKNIIVCSADSSVDISDSYETYGQGTSIHAKNIYFFGGIRSKTQYNYSQEKSQEVADLTFVKSFLEDYSEFTFYHVNRGGSRVLFSDLSYLKGEGSSFKVSGVSYSSEDQKMDVRDSSFQTGTSCNVDIKVRGVVRGRSLTIHRGNVDIEEESIKSTGYYDSKILLLSKDGYANSKPALIIKNSNTKSKHGSAISSLDRDQIMYLQSRGIPENLARSMITEGFLLTLLEQSGNDKLINSLEKYAKEILGVTLA